MAFDMNLAPDAGSIARPGDQQSERNKKRGGRKRKKERERERRESEREIEREERERERGERSAV